MITYTRFRLQRVFRQYRRGLRRTRFRIRRFVQFGMFGKWRQFAMIRRFAIGWWLIIVIMGAGLGIQIRHLQSQNAVLQPQPGGSYSEALVGTVKNINPILPEGSASADATALIFSGLTRFDANAQLQPDLASSWTISPDGRTYVFHLRRGVKWHDGVPLTARDVVFTINAIQDPDTRSPLSGSWQNVKVQATDPSTVQFTLTKAYTPFIDETTVGILPAHLLENIDPSTMPVTSFNQHPIGTGPFELSEFDATGNQITLTSNPSYYLKKPFLQTVTLRLYTDSASAFSAYTHRQVQGVDRLQPDQVAAAKALGSMNVYEATIPDEVAVFLQTTTPILKDKVVRSALATATNRQAIINSQLHGEATALTSPLLPTPAVNLAGSAHQPAYDLGKAGALLDSDGWTLGADGIRRNKDHTKLTIHLVTQTGGVYGGVARQLQQQWRQLGVEVNISEYGADELQQSYIRTRRYDALLYGINTGADPDVYSYWDSSQVKDPGLNLSSYNSPAASTALETARTIQGAVLRSTKYKSFVQTWVGDTPAVMLYTPLYEYGVNNDVYGIKVHKLIGPSDRFSDVQDWAVRVRSVSGGAQ